MKKRHVLKKFDGLRKDGKTKWYGVVLSATFTNGTLYTEKLVFVPKEAYDSIKEGTDINVQ